MNLAGVQYAIGHAPPSLEVINSSLHLAVWHDNLFWQVIPVNNAFVNGVSVMSIWKIEGLQLTQKMMK